MELTAERLWDLVSDTSRLNRALGLGRMEFEERDGSLYGSSRIAGVPHEWVEEPWEWIQPATLTAVRTYHQGFFESVLVTYRVSAEGSTSRLHTSFDWKPRSWVGRGVLWAAAPKMKRAYQRVLGELAAADSYPSRPPTKSEARNDIEKRVADRASALVRQVDDSGIVDLLMTWLSEADDLELDRIQVRRLARQWNVDVRELLRTCLHATRLGLLELRWDVICPHCRGVRNEIETLSQLAASDRCDVCDIDFATDQEEAVEVTFRVHSSVRDVPKVYYCSAEPARKRHIVVQQSLGANSTRGVILTLDPGRYRGRVRSMEDVSWITVAAGDSQSAVWDVSEPGVELSIGVGGVLELQNPSDVSRSVTLETPSWSDDALRVSELFTLQDFRDLFSEEYIAAGVQLSVGEQTILFTDVVGSSLLYEREGDAGAFASVREHFVEIGRIVDSHCGAVVKTIGDAAMAGFSEPVEAMRAAEEILRTVPKTSNLELRISLHIGPCIAVQLNSGIDYFGTTVNRTAKLQRYAEPGELVVSEELFYRWTSVVGERPDFEKTKTTATSLEYGCPVYRRRIVDVK